jgi:hypothetical protein
MDPDVFNMAAHILTPNALKKSKGQPKTIRKHYMDLDLTYIINYFYYIYCLLLHRYFYLDPISKSPLQLSAFTRGGAYKVIPDAIELFHTMNKCMQVYRFFWPYIDIIKIIIL